jgi:hypothetical protein
VETVFGLETAFAIVYQTFKTEIKRGNGGARAYKATPQHCAAVAVIVEATLNGSTTDYREDENEQAPINRSVSRFGDFFVRFSDQNRDDAIAIPARPVRANAAGRSAGRGRKYPSTGQLDRMASLSNMSSAVFERFAAAAAAAAGEEEGEGEQEEVGGDEYEDDDSHSDQDQD